MRKRIGLDLDGVIADFYMGFAKFLNSHYGCHLPLDIEPSEYSFNDWGYGIESVDVVEASNKWLVSGGMLEIPLYSGSSSFTKRLSEKADIYIVTARVGDWKRNLSNDIMERIKNDTHQWLVNHDISFKKLFFAHEKVGFCIENNISAIIEDKMTTVIDASNAGVKSILINRNYNQEPNICNSIYRAYSFEDVLKNI